MESVPHYLFRISNTFRHQSRECRSSAVGAPYEANLQLNSQYTSPAAAKQASAVHLTVFKPMVSHRTALHTHEPPLWHMGPTGPKIGRAEATRTDGELAPKEKSEAPKAR